MAKLYWRVKRGEKWTWVASNDANTKAQGFYNVPNLTFVEEEE